MKTPRLHALAALLIGFSAATASAGDQKLFEFTRDFDASKIAATGAKVSASASGAKVALHVATVHSTTWPGITLRWAIRPHVGGYFLDGLLAHIPAEHSERGFLAFQFSLREDGLYGAGLPGEQAEVVVFPIAWTGLVPARSFGDRQL